MKKLMSTNYSAGAFNFAMLIYRCIVGALMLEGGYGKLIKFGTMKNEFMNFMGMGQTVSLSLVIFAEFFCSIFLILGLFTRLATIPLIITMCVALFMVHHSHIMSDGKVAFLYLCSYLILLLVGPGKISVDGMIGK